MYVKYSLKIKLIEIANDLDQELRGYGYSKGYGYKKDIFVDAIKECRNLTLAGLVPGNSQGISLKCLKPRTRALMKGTQHKSQ